MFTHRLLSLSPPILLFRNCCSRPIVRHLTHAPSIRHSSLLSSRILPPSLRRRPQRTVRKTKPLPISPRPHSQKRRIVWYVLAFIASGGITYTALQPDNLAIHVFHGFVRCSRVTIALVHCVYDYRMTMRRKYQSEEESSRDMSDCHLRCAQRALKVFERNGGIYIKLGQHLAALSYLVPIVPSPPVLSLLISRNGFRQCQYYKMHVPPLR
jgi:hypothetical protein